MKLSLGFSPCPNDTFIFDALVNKKIDTGEFDFEVTLEDVQTLNEWALQGKLDFSKISYGMLPLVLNDYLILNSGGALGKGVGPLLVAGHPFKISEISNLTVALPGENTTAHTLFSLAFPMAQKKIFKVFSEIEDSILNGEADAGVIIHENRFTYHLKGLQKLMDLGEYWEQKTGAPVPLGGIVAKRNLSINIVQKVDELIKESIDYAYKNNYTQLSGYVKDHAQEMSEEVMHQHIELYVNEYSAQLGDDGKKAVMKLVDIYQQRNPAYQLKTKDIFV